MRPLNNPVVKQAAVAMQAAIKSGNDKKLNDAWEQFYDAVTDTLRQDFEMASGDQKALADRGFRMLTAKENKFYQEWIDSAKSPDPKQAFTDLLNGGMPETIIEASVYRGKRKVLLRKQRSSLIFPDFHILMCHGMQRVPY